MNNVIQSIFTSKETISRSGKVIPAGSFISKEQGEAIFNLIKNNDTILKTLEIGCANGVSSLYICEALNNRKMAEHTIIDPYQNSDWQGAGLKALNRAGLTNFVHISEESEFALPNLVRKGKKFDLVFVDGWHTFDHAMIDCFFANRLLGVNGFLIMDDVDMLPIGKLSVYFKNYDCYELSEAVYVYPEKFILRSLCNIFRHIPVSHNVRYYLPRWLRALFRKPRMVIFKKTSEDNRKWNWYHPF